MAACKNTMNTYQHCQKRGVLIFQPSKRQLAPADSLVPAEAQQEGRWAVAAVEEP
jgi:hypothetical protein